MADNNDMTQEGQQEREQHPAHHERAPKPNLTLEQAETFVGKALREARAQDMEGRCIDGRYEPGSGAISMAGGDAGLLAVGLALAERLRAEGEADITNELVLETVLETIGGKERFHYHSDTHNNGNFDGCGHCRLLKTLPEAYGMAPEQGQFLQETLAALNEEGIGPKVLKGDHEERAVFITQRVNNLQEKRPLTTEEVNDPATKAWVLDSQTVLPGESDASQAFVYRRGMVDMRLRAFAKALEKRLPGFELSDEQLVLRLKEVEQKHLSLTTTELAKGKPVYMVYIDAKTGEYEVVSATA